jgi:probable rRNA maturation factor
MSIDIANESGIAVDEVGLAAVARFTLDQMRIHPLAELSVLLVDERTMTELHERWMGEPGPTDVLAFPMDELRPPHLGGNRAGDPEPGDDPGLLGDVVLCPQVAAEQAVKAGHLTQDELELLTVHGILHLLGYDHAEPEEHAAMFGTQDQLLKAWRAAVHQTAGPQTAGPQTAGPQTARPQTARPQTAGPETAGPQTAGPQTKHETEREGTT